MRLLRTDTENGLRLETFDDLAETKRYAIISHRWGSNEVLYEDLMSEAPKVGDRFQKLIGCCQRARKDGYEYIWIDTCCINQSSSAELSESINSMFLWYVKAAICYAYLQDVSTTADPKSEGSAFRGSVWFMRGWTLQELIAPRNVVFFTGKWEVIGDRKTLAGTIEQITKIDYAVLCGLVDIEDISAAKKMSWASNRTTTKIEDRAYSLLGIFGVNMTTIYGEGQRAFQRLQYEIIMQSNDHSIFAWETGSGDFSETTCGLLASSPKSFAKSADIISWPFMQFANQWGYNGPVPEVQKTNAGVRLEVPIVEVDPSVGGSRRDACIMVIACKKRDTFASNSHHTVGIAVQLDSDGYYNRLANVGLIDPDRLVGLDVQRSIDRIDVRGEHKRIRNYSTVETPSRILEYMSMTYQVVVNARTLNALRNSHDLKLIEAATKTSVAKKTSRSRGRPYGQHTCQWVENPRTKEKDFMMTIQCQPTTAEDGSIQDEIHVLSFRWISASGNISLDIYMDPQNPVVCWGCKLDFFPSEPMEFSTASMAKTSYHWSNCAEGGVGRRVDAILTRASVTSQVVCYELDVIMSVARPSAPKKLELRINQRVGESDLPPAVHQLPVQWVPTCLGVVPKGAYTFRVGDIHVNQSHIVRAHHEGTIKLGAVLKTYSYALIPSFDDLRVHRVYDYEVLVGVVPLSWVPITGRFTLDALRGAEPIEGGNAEGQVLYVARIERRAANDDWNEGSAGNVEDVPEYAPKSAPRGEEVPSSTNLALQKRCYGMVRIGSVARVVWEDEVLLSRKYEVLVLYN